MRLGIDANPMLGDRGGVGWLLAREGSVHDGPPLLLLTLRLSLSVRSLTGALRVLGKVIIGGIGRRQTRETGRST